MTKQIVMSKIEYKYIHETLDKIRDISSLNPRTLEEANHNLDSINELVYRAYQYVNLHPDVDS